MQLLDGNATAKGLKNKIQAEVQQFLAKGQRAPKLIAILVGNNPASESYVGSKAKDCTEVGFIGEVRRFPDTISEDTLLAEVANINQDETVDGLIVQLPLPKHIDPNKVTLAIRPDKDVDGFHPINVGNMFKGLPALLPATPYGILLMLEQYGIKTAGKHAVVIGRSDIVGKPMSALLMRNAEPGNCTVTICHSKTADLAFHTRQADILIAAIGSPWLVKADMVKPGAIVIDVGMTRVEDSSKKSGFRLAGDVDFEQVAPKTSWITPVPGGVGPMTRAGLLMNTLNAYKNRFNLV